MLYLLVPLAYLIGSISSAVLVARARGMPDPRTVGSGNPGATNILRQGDKAAAALTLVGDLLKGLLPVLLARSVDAGPSLVAMVGAAAFLGHLYPVFFGFRGGKGVATALGVYLGVSIWTGLAVIVTWIASALVFRFSSLAAVLAAIGAPLFVWWWLRELPYLVMSLLLTALLLWRHRTNIRRLLRGEEDRIVLRK